VSLAQTRMGLGVLTGLYSAFANPVPERLGYGMVNMRLSWRDAKPKAAPSQPIGTLRAPRADKGQLFRCCSSGIAGCLVSPAGSPGPMGRRWLAPVLPSGPSFLRHLETVANK
jgi:hypothetical protein